MNRIKRVKEELYSKDNGYSLYQHKKTKKHLTQVLDKYFVDYETEVKDIPMYGAKELIIVIYDRDYINACISDKSEAEETICLRETLMLY